MNKSEEYGRNTLIDLPMKQYPRQWNTFLTTGGSEKSQLYLDRDLAIALRPLELLDSFLHDLLGQQGHRHVSSSLIHLLPTLLYITQKNSHQHKLKFQNKKEKSAKTRIRQAENPELEMMLTKIQGFGLATETTLRWPLQFIQRCIRVSWVALRLGFRSVK